jgi:ribosomal protein L37AE/L43A
MPSKSEIPDTIKPYLFHGVEVQYRAGEKEAVGTCPFCGREGKFSVNAVTGKWKCWACDGGTKKGGGNPLTFLQQLWTRSDELTTNYGELATERRLLYPDTLMSWGVCKSVVDGVWMVPGYAADGTLRQLYRWVTVQGKHKLLPTPTMGHHLHGVNLYSKQKDEVFLCEGPWDAMALWEVLCRVKIDDKGDLHETASKDHCWAASANVLAVPGCMTFFDSWLKLFKRKTVYLCYDNDHPRMNPKTERMEPPAALRGLQRAASILAHAKEPPEFIRYLRWGEAEQFDLQRPSGYDVRDLLTTP